MGLVCQLVRSTPAAEGITGVAESGSDATLTYTTDKSLDMLAEGQSMTQQPAYTPVTDTIKAIVQVSNWNQEQIWSDGATGWANDPALAFDGQRNTFANSNQSSGSNGVYTFGAISGNLQVRVSTDEETANGRTNTFTLSDGTTFSTSAGYQGNGEVISIGEVSGITSISTDPGGMIYQMILDGKILVNTGLDSSGAGTLPELEFNTPKDIVNFRPGDVVQSEGTGNPSFDESQVWSSYLSTDFTLNNPKQCFDGNTGTYGEAWNGSYDNVNTVPPYNLEFIPPTPIEGPVEVWSPAQGDGIYRNRWQVDTGSGYSATTYVTQNTWIEVVPAGQSLVKYQQFSDANGTSFSAIKVNGKILVDPTSVVKVVSTADAANSKMTVDGGNWSDGSGVPADQNQDEVWSSYGTGTMASSNYSWEQCFNGRKVQLD